MERQFESVEGMFLYNACKSVAEDSPCTCTDKNDEACPHCQCKFAMEFADDSAARRNSSTPTGAAQPRSNE